MICEYKNFIPLFMRIQYKEKLRQNLEYSIKATISLRIFQLMKPQLFVINNIMEIPDLNYNKTHQETTSEGIDFYSLDENSFHQSNSNYQEQFTYESNFHPILHDQIMKKTMNLSWQQRQFELTPIRLIYFQGKDRTQVKGCFNIISLRRHQLKVEQDGAVLKLSVCTGYDQKNIKHRKEILQLNFEQIQDKKEKWKNELEKIVYKSYLTQQERFPSIFVEQIKETHPKIQGDNFWNRIIISLGEMEDYVDHLDIIFFRSKNPIASFHRFFMRSKFDHVGLLFKDNKNNLLILEAIQSRGVWINQWKQMLPIFQQNYEEIAIRKLIIAKNQHKFDLNSLENYLNSIIGTKYELSISKLLVSQESTIKDLANQNQNPNERKPHTMSMIPEGKKKSSKTFFCSELIADVYIKCGLIKGKKRNQFWPKDFESADITLQGGAYLSPLMYVDI